MQSKFFLMAIFNIAFVSICIADTTITKIDRNKLYSKYNIPKYSFPSAKTQGLTLEDTIKFVKMDIYDYAKIVEKDYMEKVQAPIALFYPQATKEKISMAVEQVLTSEEQLSNPAALSTIITNGMKSQLDHVHAMNMDPVYAMISDLHAEVITLKEHINVLEEKISIPLRKSNESQDNTLIYIALGMSVLSLIISVSQSSKKSK